MPGGSDRPRTEREREREREKERHGETERSEGGREREAEGARTGVGPVPGGSPDGQRQRHRGIRRTFLFVRVDQGRNLAGAVAGHPELYRILLPLGSSRHILHSASGFGRPRSSCDTG